MPRISDTALACVVAEIFRYDLLWQRFGKALMALTRVQVHVRSELNYSVLTKVTAKSYQNAKNAKNAKAILTEVPKFDAKPSIFSLFGFN
jgi:hypothetical protein